MNLESAGYGGLGSVITGLLVAVGFKSRMDKQEEDFKSLKESVVYKDTCSVCSGNTNKKLDYIIDRLDKHFDRRDNQ
jgi:hypothetical protein